MGAGLGRGRRWPWSWESAYLKALSSLCLSFFLPLLPTSVARRAPTFPTAWGSGRTLLAPPWKKGPVPAGLLPLLFFFWAV